VIAPYDHNALWSKAKVFLNRAMDPDPVRSFDEQALWASAALELLGKAALARVSPLLIAEPTEDGANLLVATGLIEGTAQFTSVRASTIFKRCQRAFRPFSASDALRFATARNEYLHGSGIGFMTLAPQAWWPRYWALASILVTAQDRDIEDLVGPDRVSVVEAHLEQNAKNVEHRAEALISRARQRLAQYQARCPRGSRRSGGLTLTSPSASATARMQSAQPAEQLAPSKATTTATSPTMSTTRTSMDTPTCRRRSACPPSTSAAPPATWCWMATN
jgi:hypothetical protein